VAFGSRVFGANWGNSFSREPEQVFQDKEEERANQLISAASQQKYGTDTPPRPSVFGNITHWGGPPVEQDSGGGGFLGKLKSAAGSVKDAVTDNGLLDSVKNAHIGVDFSNGPLSAAKDVASLGSLEPVSSTVTSLGHHVAGDVAGAFVGQDGNIDTNPVEAAKNVGRAAIAANPVSRITGSILQGRNPYGEHSNDSFNRFQDSNAPVGVKKAVSVFSDLLTYLGGPKMGVGFAVGTGAAAQATENAPAPIQQAAEIGGGIVGATIAHDPAAAGRLATKGARLFTGEGALAGERGSVRADFGFGQDKTAETAQRHNVDLGYDESGNMIATDPEHLDTVIGNLRSEVQQAIEGRIPKASGGKSVGNFEDAPEHNVAKARRGKANNAVPNVSPEALQAMDDLGRLEELAAPTPAHPRGEEFRQPFPTTGGTFAASEERTATSVERLRTDSLKRAVGTNDPVLPRGKNTATAVEKGTKEATALADQLAAEPGATPSSVVANLAAHVQNREFDIGRLPRNLSVADKAFRQRVTQITQELERRGHAAYAGGDVSAVAADGVLPTGPGGDIAPAADAATDVRPATVQRVGLDGTVTDTGRTETQLNGLSPEAPAPVARPSEPAIQQSFDGSVQELPGMPRAGQGQPPVVDHAVQGMPPKPPAEPPTTAAGGEPPSDAVQAARDYVDAAKKELPGRNQQLSDFKGSQAAAYRDTYDKVYAATGDVAAANAAARAAQRGATANFSGGAHLNPEMVPDLLQKAHDAHVANKIDDFEFGRVVDHLTAVAAGDTTGSIPGHLLADFEKTFGAEKVRELMGGNQGSLFDERQLPGGNPSIPEPGTHAAPPLEAESYEHARWRTALDEWMKRREGPPPIEPTDPRTSMPMDLGPLSSAGEPPLFGESGAHLPEPGPHAEATPSINRAARNATPGEYKPPAEPTAPGYSGVGPPPPGKVFDEKTRQWVDAPTSTDAVPPPEAQSAIGRPDIPVQKPGLAGDALEPVPGETPANPLAPPTPVDPLTAKKQAIEKRLGIDSRTREQIAADRESAAAGDAKKAEVNAAADAQAKANMPPSEYEAWKARQSAATPPKPPRSTLGKIWDTTADILNLPIALKAGGDVSYVLRQALPIAAGNPREIPAAARALKLALTDPEGFKAWKQAILDDPYYKTLTKDAGLHLSSFAESPSAREEQFASRLVQKGGKYNPLAYSEKANTAYLDSLRWEVARKTLQNMIRDEAMGGEVITPERLTQLGEVMSHGSGRGTGSALDSLASWQVSPLFSARNFMSKPQLIADMVRTGGAARQQAIRQVVGFGLVVGGFDALAAAAGAKIGIDRDPGDLFGLTGGNFARAGLGANSVDLSGGLAGTVRDVAQIGKATKQVASGEQPFRPVSDILGQFARGKLSPTFGFLADNLIFHENYDQTPVDWKSLGGVATQMDNLFGSLVLNDVYNAGQAEMGNGFTPEGGLKTFLLGSLALAGAGMNSGLSPSENRAAERDKQAAALNLGSSYDALSAADKAKVNQQPSVATLDRAAQNAGSNQTGKFTVEYEGKRDKLDALHKAGDINGIDYRHSIQDAEKTRRDELTGAGQPKGDDLLSQYFALYDAPGIADQLLTKNYDGLDQLQAQFTAAHPEVLDQLSKAIGSRDSATRARLRTAQQQAKEYYAIPKYLNLSDADAKVAEKVLAKATSMVTNGQASSRQDAFARLNASGTSEDDIALAQQAARTAEQNPARKAFARDPAHSAFAEFYKGADVTQGDVGSVATVSSSGGGSSFGGTFGSTPARRAGAAASSRATSSRRVGLRR